MTDAVPEVSQVSEVKDEVKLNEYEFRVAMSCVRTALPLKVVCDVITMTRKPILEIIGKPKVGEAVAKNLVSEVAKQAPGPSPAA
ncbi:hypothetical protein GGI03_000109 [Coemansia sp. RSA 2337]|nr:hypothetical protein GGI03_000109 [Coemansia sp. RSA 2337]